MNKEKKTNKNLYYTKDHEWVDFQGTVAYTGVCQFKLLGFKGVHKVKFKGVPGFQKQGEVIAIIKYNDYQIEAHMPVDGKLVAFNETFFSSNPDLLLQHAESAGWIALIAPSQPFERKDLLLPKQYQMNGKGKYAK